MKNVWRKGERMEREEEMFRQKGEKGERKKL